MKAAETGGDIIKLREDIKFQLPSLDQRTS
jgi:hypothetical protein